MDHLEKLKQRIRECKVQPPPPPWKRFKTATIGGLTEVGLADDSELLLVLSWQGRGVFDGATGERLARDSSDDRANWYGRDNLIAKGFGPLEGKEVRLAGLWGGGLLTHTDDHWHALDVTIEWPDEHLLLVEPGVDLSKAGARFSKLGVEREVRAFGFSYTGKTLVMATSSDLTIFGRS